VTAGDVVERDGRLTVDFEDPEGQRLSLVDDGGQGHANPWSRSPVAPENQVRGLGPIILSVPALAPTDRVLQKVMNMRPMRHYEHPENRNHTVHVYEMSQGGAHAELHIAVQPDLPAMQLGAGGVHHVAFRSPDADYDAWADRLNTMGVPNSGKVDRYWFRSLYFREPNGILFEIASDGPGFAVDEPEATLGESVVLPPFLEPHRDEIVSALKPID
jgi:glyoxalase family protein